MIDRSMWFAKSYEALADDDFAAIVRKNPILSHKQDEFREPVTFAFSYAQRVFLCSAMELCLLHQYANSIAIMNELTPSHIHNLKQLLQVLKGKPKIKTWNEWDCLQREEKGEKLRQLSFSNLQAAANLFDEIYGSDCFSLVWGLEGRNQLEQKYSTYQTLRNGIVHRGGERVSGDKIQASEDDITKTFEDAQQFRDAILRLSSWCRAWWLKRFPKTSATE